MTTWISSRLRVSKELLASLNVNGRAIVDHNKVGLSHWNKLHELDIRAVAIQDTRLSTPDKQSAAQRQANMFAVTFWRPKA